MRELSEKIVVNVGILAVVEKMSGEETIAPRYALCELKRFTVRIEGRVSIGESSTGQGEGNLPAHQV